MYLEKSAPVYLDIEKGDQVPFSHRNGSWTVTDGIVQLSSLSLKGDEITVGVAKEGCIIAPINKNLDVAMIALTKVRIEKRPIEIIDLWQQVQLKEEFAYLMGQKGTRNRLILLLRFLGIQSKHDGHFVISKISHQALADILNSTRVTVTRLIGTLVEEQIVSIGKRCYYLKVNSNATQIANIRRKRQCKAIEITRTN